jgi:hypothetical protein
MGQDFIHQQGGAVGHSSRPTAGAKAAPFATERHQLLVMASLTPDPEKAMLQPHRAQTFYCEELNILQVKVIYQSILQCLQQIQKGFFDNDVD